MPNYQYKTLKPLAQFLVRNNLRYVLYFWWLCVLPAYLLVYCEQAAEDATIDLKDLKAAKFNDSTYKE